MRIKKIYYTSNFAKKAAKLPPHLKTQIENKEKLFRENPFYPTLKTHQLKGKLKGLWSFSLTYTHRILFEFVGRDEVLFFDVGTHEIYQ